MKMNTSSQIHSAPSLVGRAGGESSLFTFIYIAGTAMALAFTMVMAVVYYIKLAPIYPEVNRARTVYFEGIRVVADNNGRGQMGFGQKAFEEWFQQSPNIEHCAPTLLACGTGEVSQRARQFVHKGKDEYLEAITNRTNADFFHIYEYEFLAGRPFTAKEVEARETVCVISDAFAERLYGRDADALGQLVAMEDGSGLRVVGVIRGASQLTPDSHADLIVPYTLWDERIGSSPYVGQFAIVATVKDTEHLQALKQELDEVAARLSLNQYEFMGGVLSFGEGVKTHVELTSKLESHAMHVLRAENGDVLDEISNWQLIKHYAGLLFVLLFVPALNLCAIVAGRMERRAPEMAVRKTFGARRSTLLRQVVNENLVMTSIGGIIGLILAWLAIYAFRTEILGMFFDHTTLGSAPLVSGEMLFSPLLFLAAFLAILVLNLLAAVVPAWWSLRKPIVEDLNQKQ